MNQIKISGEYTDAVIYTTDNPNTAIDEYALAQIQQLCDFEAVRGNKIRVMPDVHPGAGCVIGLTMELSSNHVMPNLVGVDIGCGIGVTYIGDSPNLDFKKLDVVIRDNVPSGFSVHSKPKEISISLEDLVCSEHVDIDRGYKSVGTLGGGNHFIEVAKDSNNGYYLVVHTGSRNLGKQLCEWYISCGRNKDIPRELTYISNSLADNYLHDMKIAQEFAEINRNEISKVICREMKWKRLDYWESVHNYIDFSYDTPILRKGAIKADSGVKCIIPANMRDGSIIGIGKGNPDWNFSSPHGSGRISSRKKARELHTLSEFRESMTGIYSTCIDASTLDESPFAYRNQSDILEAIPDTVEVIDIIKPVYNFKAGGKS